ncbi:MAG: hypothetical protein SH847_16885 [Roseiflexaceae bacterium]|nr:hypothetical protein [Roseiflexaceae bacterium]
MLYQTLIWAGLLNASDGITQWENNVVRAQRYLYRSNEPIRLVLVGSSLANNIKASDIAPNVANLAMAGGATQTGLEMIRRDTAQPSILLVEINDTIDRQEDSKLIASLYDPALYWLRMWVPIFREEYRPASVFVSRLRRFSDSESRQLANRAVANPGLLDAEVARLVAERNTPFTLERAALIRSEAEGIKVRLLILRQAGWRVVLFDLPRDQRIENTTQQKQVRAMLYEIFPPDQYEWLPAPPARDWLTQDGLHLIRADAHDFGQFIYDQLLK